MSKSQFRSVIKSRESIQSLTNANNVFKTELGGNTKSNNLFNSAKNLQQVKNTGFDSNNLNYNSDANSDDKKKDNNNISINEIDKGNSMNAAAGGKNLNPGFGPAISATPGDLNLEDSTKQIDFILSIKPPEVFNYDQKLTAKEIEKMVKQYKTKLHAELLKILNEEKSKEDQREIVYSNTVDSAEKKRLGKVISLERNQSSDKIMKINE